MKELAYPYHHQPGDCLFYPVHVQMPSTKLTWQWKFTMINMKYIFKSSILPCQFTKGIQLCGRLPTLECWQKKQLDWVSKRTSIAGETGSKPWYKSWRIHGIGISTSWDFHPENYHDVRLENHLFHCKKISWNAWVFQPVMVVFGEKVHSTNALGCWFGSLESPFLESQEF